MESNDIRALGIYGMGGIGKTTTAKAFYNKYSHKFDISCFMENVKQYSQGGSPPLPLLQLLVIELLRVKDYKVRDVESALRKLEEIFSSKKALIVLDDLDQLNYSELLVRICKLFSHGSRVIITARDANLLNQLKVEMSKVDTFFVKHLNETNSLELFSYYAFKKTKPPRNYIALSKSFVTYAGGLPLALKVLGSSLCGRTDVSFWKAKLEKIQKIPVEEIQKILQLSYVELDDEMVKAIFLDIVFFFVGKNKDEVVQVFDSCGFFPEVGISILVERCLLEIDEHYNELRMHNLIQDMGKKVIRQESKYGKCQRLYLDQEEALQSLQNLQGFEKIEGLILDLTLSTNKYCKANLFKRLPNKGRFTFADMQNPLFLHPSDGPSSVSVPKLQGATDFRSWKRSMEIQLAAKRKLGFVTGTVMRDVDETNGVQWDTCNNLVISWLHNNVSDSIRKSILFVESASEIWTQLEKRFLLSNGSHKYKLNRDLFSLKQNKLLIADYFTAMSEIWEEIDALNVLPAIPVITPEIAKLLEAITTLREEAKLFQFLNGLNDEYASQRSQLLLMNPLPTVESACAAIQQEESQRDVLKKVPDFKIYAMYSKSSGNRIFECNVCHGKGHTTDRCWTVIGYPKWHVNHNLKPGQRHVNSDGSVQSGKWTGKHNVSTGSRMSNNAAAATIDTGTNSALIPY